jgi:ethanolamine utilization protein EutQ (cupin superfamily)
MITLIERPSIIESAGTKNKLIQEYVGRVNSKTNSVSIAKMDSPERWCEPGQTPEFNEYTVVLKGKLYVKSKGQDFTVEAGQAIIVEKGEWIQYSTPFKGGATYIAVCLPAFGPDIVHRDE